MIKILLVLVCAVIYSCHGYMMEMTHCHPETKYCEAEFVVKILVRSKREVRLFRNGTFRVIGENRNEENNFGFDDSENNPSGSEVEIFPNTEGSSDQPEVFPAGPDTNQGGREVNWPGIRPSHSRSNQATENGQYSVRGPQGSRPGERPILDNLKLADSPVPIPNRPQDAQRRHSSQKKKRESGMIRRIRSTAGTGGDVESDQPEEFPAGPDASDGGREVTWGRVQPGRPNPRSKKQSQPYSSRGPAGSRPGIRGDFESLNSGSLRLPDGPVPIPLGSENQNSARKDYSQRGSAGSRPGHSGDFESLNSASLRLPGGPVPIPIGSENQDSVRKDYSQRGSRGSRPGHSGDFESLNSASLRLPGGPVPIPIGSENSANRQRSLLTRTRLNLRNKIREHSNSGSRDERDFGGLETQYLIDILEVYKGNVSSSTVHLYSPLTSNLGHADFTLNGQYVIMGCFFRKNLLHSQQSDFKMNLNRFNEAELRDFETSLTRRYERNCGRCPIKVCSHSNCPQRSNDYCVWKNPTTLTEASTVHFICVEKRTMPRHCAWRNFLYPGTIQATQYP